MKVQRALISVFDKSGLEQFAKGLTDLGVEVISTGGTARLLKDSGIPVTLVEDVTGFPEMLDGRVKTMHPKLMAGILARRDVPEHMETIAAHGIGPIDMVVCSLYPFEEVAGRRGVEDEVVIENIDIGGPSMIRAAAKNHAGVAVVTSHEDYDELLAELRETGGEIALPTLRELATRAFHRTAHYDFVIANWFSEADGDFPDHVMRDYHKVLELKYGENPHQRAAYYAEVGMRQHLLSQVTQLHGKQLGFNNLYDLHAARTICDEFTLPCVTIVKHNNPCGCALAENVAAAYDKAFACDPVSAFGGVIAVNRTVDAALAERLSDLFVEVLFAPSYDEDALAILTRKADIRILKNDERRQSNPGEFDYKRVSGGILVQDKDGGVEERDEMTVATKRHPSEQEWGDMIFAFRVAKHVKSNAIVIARDLATLGVGAGQMSRVDSTRIAIDKARSGLQGAVVGSDAFYPFPDAVELAIESGVTAFMQPGGSKGDESAVETCDAHGASMVFTGRRHFLH
ncbi:MAG: bifunctional phosphoribosylaminoimidazolecarboxamide formyltransferase/IMP cyclohydrolase [Thermoleophilia bacterium]